MSTIEWTDKTWNPVRGCSRVSSGCDNCYAMRQAHRFSGPGGPYEGLTTIRRGKVDWTGTARLVPELLSAPLKWRKPQRIFVNSMSDLFHESLSNEDIAAVFGVMAACPQHTFQVLTKRPKRALEFFAWLLSHPEDIGPVLQVSVGQFWPDNKDELLEQLGELYAEDDDGFGRPLWPLRNVHLGVSAEDQDAAEQRIPLLLQCPAYVHWVSAEPLLGDIDLSQVAYIAPPGIDWIVVGGESGAGARPCNIEWIRSIVQQCKTATVPVFVKQLGAKSFDWDQVKPTGRLLIDPDTGKSQVEFIAKKLNHKKGADPSEWPEDLRVRELPEVSR